jgi:tetratricopeptide (TPR) repeat protein
MAPNLRSLTISFLALREGLSQKEIGTGAGFQQKRVSRILGGAEIEDDDFERLLAAVKGRPAKVLAVAGCLDALEAIEQAGDFTDEELAEIETEVLGFTRLIREGLMAALRRTRPPAAGSAEPAPASGQDAEELQRWLLCAAVCEQSVREASRDLGSAAALARLAREIAEPARLPEGARLQGYAAGYEANILRVSDELKAAEIGFLEAERLWESGSDPFGVLDPGRLPDLEASLRRAQRRLPEALALLEKAVAVGWFPERSRVNKATIREVMGEYEPAIEILLEAAPKIDPQGEPRLMTVLLFDLAVLYCHVGRHAEAAELVPRVRALATELGDELDLVRLIWLEGRVAAGQGRAGEARQLLAQARQEFAARGMAYDVALALLEEAVLLLEEGRAAEVKALAQELTKVFAEKGVHREALAALRLFYEAAEREEATAELGRRVLRYLYRARHDPELRFEARG